MKRKEKIVEDTVRVIRDSSKDYFISKELAKELENEGKITRDLTNHCYCEL